jgi:dipeptidyl aminopeptidase/acylaminoacyl peptidase
MLVRLPLLLLALTTIAFASDYTYQQPPKEIRDVLNAPPTPAISVSPRHDYAILMQAVRYAPIAQVAQPFLPLAAIRVDANTNSLHMANYYISFAIKRLPGGEDVAIALPRDGKFSAPLWSPDGTQFAFTNTVANGVELWIGSPSTGEARRIPNISVNGVQVGNGFQAGGAAIQWLGDNRTLIVSTVPGNRGPVPVEPAIPLGPHVRESTGHAGPAPTFEDLLATPHDEDLFDYYATSQLVYLDAASGKSTPLGKPAIYTVVHPSPDQTHVLVGWLHKPYSYQLTARSFPEEIEIWNRTGKLEYKVASLPLADRVPLAGVRTGPRSYQWLQDKPATLVWAQALDGGDPKAKVPYRDAIVMLAAPFSGQPKEIFKTEQRFRSLQPLASGKALVEDYERVKRIERMFEINLDRPETEARLIFSLNERDAYHDPGTPVLKTTPDGRHQVLQSGDEIYLEGQGASPTGDRPFLDRFNLATGKAERLFQSDANAYEAIVAVLDDNGTRLLTRRESPTDPPNYFIHSASETKPLTHFPNPAPQTAGIKKQLVTYKRADGVPLSFTLYLPADYKPGTKLPALIWAYPYEFSDADTAGQVTGHAAQAFSELNYHQLFVMHGYALLDNAAMPIIGDAETVNNTYVDQLVMDAQAAVDKAVEMGIADRDRVGVFGHSYGAFMTANLLAHSKLFRAAVAESGAYNRTLTPFGFQTEERTFWEAPDVYTKMSPFWFADKIKTPILLIHGEADDNTGTYPIQSERMFAAIRGNGGTVRLVMLPAEAHGYRGKESLEHVLYEELTWFDKYLQ